MSLARDTLARKIAAEMSGENREPSIPPVAPVTAPVDNFAEWMRALPVPTLPESELDGPDPEAVLAQRDRQRSLERSIPMAYRWARMTALELGQRVRPVALIDRVEDILHAERVVFMGPSGDGKTSLSVACLRAWWERHRQGRALFVHAYRLGVARIQHAAGDGEAASVEDAMRAGLVLVDDLGNERQTATNALPDVLFERHAESRPTWITTGLTVDEVTKRYGDGIARRIFERALVLKFGGGAR